MFGAGAAKFGTVAELESGIFVDSEKGGITVVGCNSVDIVAITISELVRSRHIGLSILNDCILWGIRVYTPKQEQQYVLTEELHGDTLAHQE